MSQSLAKMYVHIVFRSKNGQYKFSNTIEPQLYTYIATILKANNSPALSINGANDHIHILCVLSKNISIAKLFEEVKKSSSKWIKTKDDYYKKFHWQNGYGAFSVSASQVEKVKRYVENQKEHHRKMTFQNELRKFFNSYNINFDERYVWD